MVRPDLVLFRLSMVYHSGTRSEMPSFVCYNHLACLIATGREDLGSSNLEKSELGHDRA